MCNEKNPIQDGIDFMKRLEALEDGLRYFLEKESEKITAEIKTVVPNSVTRPNEYMQGWIKERESRLIRVTGVLNRMGVK